MRRYPVGSSHLGGDGCETFREKLICCLVMAEKPVSQSALHDEVVRREEIYPGRLVIGVLGGVRRELFCFVNFTIDIVNFRCAGQGYSACLLLHREGAHARTGAL